MLHEFFDHAGTSGGTDSPNPDIAVSHAVTVVLQFQRILGGLRSIFGELPVYRWTHHLFMELNQDLVMNHGEECWTTQLFARESRRFEKNIVGLPLARFPRGVNQRRPLPVYRASLPVRVGGFW